MLTKRNIKYVARIILAALPGTRRLLDLTTLYVRLNNRHLDILPIKQTTNFSEDLMPPEGRKRLFYDVSALYLNNDARGIHRVVINVLNQLFLSYADNFEVVTVRSTRNGIFRCKLDGRKDNIRKYPSEGELINAKPGDIFISLDLYRKFNFIALQELKRNGLKVYFVVYDLLDIRTCCLGENDFLTRMMARIARVTYKNWLHAVLTLSDGIVCDSHAIVTELIEYLGKNENKYQRTLPIGFFHLGADFTSSRSTIHDTYIHPLSAICGPQNKPCFLMVGVMDPHKGHAQVIHAFEQLWHSGIDVKLIIIGKEGLLQPNIGELIRRHEEFNHRLFWFEYVSDEVLLSFYNQCTALIAASFSEGFGLPLIEAAHYRLPIIAREIPVFKEVAGDYAYYFKNNDACDIVEAITNWLTLADQNKIPQSDGMPYLDWAASTSQLIDVVVNNRWCVYWGVGESGQPKFTNYASIDHF